jgi:MFS family permease
VTSSIVMYYFSTGVALTSMLGPPFGAWILQKNIWLPFVLCAALLFTCYPVLLMLPETLRPHSQTHADHVTSEESEESQMKTRRF